MHGWVRLDQRSVDRMMVQQALHGIVAVCAIVGANLKEVDGTIELEQADNDTTSRRRHGANAQRLRPT